MSASGISDGLKALWILGRDDNNKKLSAYGGRFHLESCINEVLRKICQFGSINEIVRLF
jgi:hypothetical protein